MKTQTAPHCPGDWAITRKPDTYMASFEIRSYAAPQSESGLIDEHIAEVDGEENARLIAAAPDLLAALQCAEEQLRRVAHLDTSYHDASDAARHAIAKATGQ